MLRRSGRVEPSFKNALQLPGGLILEAVHSLQHVPAVVFSAEARCWLEVDLFPGVLADVGDKEVSRHAIKSTAPWVSHAVCPDLIKRIRIAHEWIVRWHGIIAVRVAWKIVPVDVHAENFAQPDLEILAILLRVASAAAVAQTGV